MLITDGARGTAIVDGTLTLRQVAETMQLISKRIASLIGLLNVANYRRGENLER